MAKILNDQMLKDILEELGDSAYFYQKEKGKERKEEKEFYDENGSVVVTFISALHQVPPGDNDILGKPWHPKVKDNDGNPLLDRSGKPKKAWDKFEIKALIKGQEKVYGLGSSFGAQLRGTLTEMVKNNLKSEDLPGTQWKFKSLPNWKWDVTYIGKVELPKENKKSTETPKKANGVPIKDKVIQGVNQVKEKSSFSQKLAGIGKADFINATSFFSEIDEKRINSMWQEILDSGIIKEEGNKIFFI